MFSNHLLKKNLLLLFLLVSLFSWGTATTIMLLKKSDKLVLVGIDQNGTRLITNLDDPLYKVEVVNFIRKFFSLLYNFDAGTFDQNLGDASDLMSLDLWKSQEAQVLKLGQEVKKEKIAHSSDLKSIAKDEDGSFEVLLHTSESYRAKTVGSDLRIKLQIKKVARTEKNPWGMEIVSLEESKI